MTVQKTKVVVVGAGVIGLTAALVLADEGNCDVTVVAKHMPGDNDIEYCSPVAGANYLPVGKSGSLLADLERATWSDLNRLASSVPEAGVHFQNTHLYRRAKDGTGPVGEWNRDLMLDSPWYKDVVPNFRSLERSELPPQYESGLGFTSVCINVGVYLPWLASWALEAGVALRRGVVAHLGDAGTMHRSGAPAAVVVNATGLGSRDLAGVRDGKVFPARGQTVLVRDSPRVMIATSGTDDAGDEACYIMERAAGGGTILGGCQQLNNWDGTIDFALAIRIMQRCTAVCPALGGGLGAAGLSVIRHGVGLRPMREGGPRVERDEITLPKGPDPDADFADVAAAHGRPNPLPIVHCYGHGGAGYQTSWGTARMVLKLVKEAVGGEGEQAKL